MGNQTSRNDGDGLTTSMDGSDGVKEKDGKNYTHRTPTASMPLDTVVPTSQMLTVERSMSRSASGADVTEKYLTQLVPIEKLAEILKEKSGKFGVNGILAEVFVSQVFPIYIDLGHRLFRLMHNSSKATTEHLGTIAFRQQCERFLGIMDDAKVLDCYIKMFAQKDNPELITKDGVTHLLLTCYTIAMQHAGNAVLCPAISRTFGSVTKSIFFNSDTLSIGFVCRWFEQNLIRLVLLVHKYCVHTLSTAYRGLELQTQSCGIELQTPVLDQRNPFPEGAANKNAANRTDTAAAATSAGKSSNIGIGGAGGDVTDAIGVGDNTSMTLMPLSQAWLLAGALPPLYSKPQTVTSPTSANKQTAVQIFKDKLSMMPSHWTLLYDSNEHGVGANRFLHHVLGYRGPTLILLHTNDEQTYCIAAPSEWKETHLFTGAEGSCILQLQPKFVILEKKPNILYLNTTIRGYPKGLRAGADPRKPVLAVDEYFDKIDCKGIAAGLLAIEVWGCGDKTSREVQLDIKKWQIKEAERQRTVKLTAADWMDHPDRYLLELGGRQNYNN